MKKLIFTTLLLLISGISTNASVIKKINILSKGNAIKVSLDQASDFRVYQSDKYELILIFKDTDIAPDILTGGSGGNIISKIIYEHFPDGIGTITVQTTTEIQSISKQWNKNDNTLYVAYKTKSSYKVKAPYYASKKQKKPLKIKSAKHFTAKKQYTKSKKRKSLRTKNNIKKYAITTPKKTKTTDKTKAVKKPLKDGGINTLLSTIKPSKCSTFVLFKVALRAANQKDFAGSLNATENLIAQKPDSECLEFLNFLKIYLEYKGMDTENKSALIAIQNDIQKVLNKYSDSKLIPYGYALAGLTNLKLNNKPMAAGYFEIIEKQYPNYSGMAEIYYRLGNIYYEKNNIRNAEAYLKTLSSKFPNTKFAMDSNIIRGKILYTKKHYYDTIKTLSPLIKKNQKVLYKNPQLLDYVADSYFQTGNNEKARGLFSRIFNVFPMIEKKDMILTRIGETFEEEGHKDKALKIYNLVIQKYPGTTGFVKSSLHLADNMDDDAARENIYRMIESDFPDSVEARISLMRLAKIYLKQKKYGLSIKFSKKLLHEHTRALRKEALNLLSIAMSKKLENLVNKDKIPDSLRIVEKNRFYIEDMKNFDIHFIAGKIYTKAHVYSDAKVRLNFAEKLYSGKKIPAPLLKYQAIANRESKDQNSAIQYLDRIIKTHKKSDLVPWAFELKGDIRKDQKKFKKADFLYKNAANKYKTGKQKGDIFKKLGELSEKRKNTKKSEIYFTKAIYNYENYGKEYSQNITYCAKKLGEAYIKDKKFKKAVKAFLKVINYKYGIESKLEVNFLLGEAYRGEKQIDKALKTYKKIITMESDEELWKKIADQRIKEIELNRELKN